MLIFFQNQIKQGKNNFLRNKIHFYTPVQVKPGTRSLKYLTTALWSQNWKIGSLKISFQATITGLNCISKKYYEVQRWLILYLEKQCILQIEFGDSIWISLITSTVKCCNYHQFFLCSPNTNTPKCSKLNDHCYSY